MGRDVGYPELSFRGSSQSPLANVGDSFLLSHDLFLPDPYQFTNYTDIFTVQPEILPA